MANISYIQITRECNQECKFCSNPPNDNILDYKKAFKILNEFKKKGFDEVILTGGEPTLHNKLNEIISYSINIGIKPRIITNGQKLSDFSYFESIIKSGLKHIHLSIHSYKPEIQNFLTNNDNSLENIKKTLENCKAFDVTVNINTVINKYNSDHLNKNIEWFVENYKFINHFVLNNIDPFMNRVEKNPDVIPKLQDFEISLNKACYLLVKNKKTFRIERVPLCYMAEFAEFSTETRKIIKNEGRTIFFLDFRGRYNQNSFYYEKPSICKSCTLNPLCAGIYGGNKYFSFDEIFPVFINKDNIIKKIKNN